MLRITALTLVLVVCTGCIGQKTRDKVVLPAVQLAVPGVQENVNHGIDVFPDLEDRSRWLLLSNDFFDMIVHADNLVFSQDMVSVWVDLREFATYGIENRVITGVWGVGVGESATERLNKFEESLNLGVRR